ncbi:hypothetical protein HYU96_00445 [Candidatus Daviesbacteria bacterium]|nr:hypothetical protein [Candidatus Daviesbacteria bacterium]
MLNYICKSNGGELKANEEVQEFKKITLEVYGRQLTDEEAQDQGTRLVTAFELILKHKQEGK